MNQLPHRFILSKPDRVRACLVAAMSRRYHLLELISRCYHTLGSAGRQCAVLAQSIVIYSTRISCVSLLMLPLLSPSSLHQTTASKQLLSLTSATPRVHLLIADLNSLQSSSTRIETRSYCLEELSRSWPCFRSSLTLPWQHRRCRTRGASSYCGA